MNTLFVAVSTWDMLCDIGNGALTLLDDSLDDIEDFSSEAGTYSAMATSLSLSTMPHTAAIPGVGKINLIILGVSAAATIFFGVVEATVGGIKYFTGSNGVKLNGEELSAEESSQRESESGGGIASGLFKILIGIAGTYGANYYKPYITNQNKPQANQQATSQGTSGAKVSASDIKFTDKFSKPGYQNQVAQRGWNNQKIADTINNPYKVADSVNNFTGNTVKVYYINEMHYVAIDSVTNKVVQVSNLSDSAWKFTPGDFAK